MIIFPSGFCKTKYPGYYWNEMDQKLYSIKSGVVKPLTLTKPYTCWKGTYPAGYNLSINGDRKFVSLDMLKKIRYTGAVQVVDIAKS